MFHIFIPSKGRAKQTILTDNPLTTYIVEPQDYQDYLAVLPESRLIKLAANDRGIAFARNFILEYCKENDITWYWMLDDDVTGFFESKDGKNYKISMDEALFSAEREIKTLNSKYSIGQAGLEYQQYSWSAKKKHAMNSYCDVCVAINSKVPVRYRKELALKEDRDFTLQVISNGYTTVRCSKIAFACPSNGSNDGGLEPLYKDKTTESQSNRAMVRLWGDNICRVVVKPSGREDVKINWRYFKI
jgi:hypothetical protein